jgi:hypothetical protein
MAPWEIKMKVAFAGSFARREEDGGSEPSSRRPRSQSPRFRASSATARSAVCSRRSRPRSSSRLRSCSSSRQVSHTCQPARHTTPARKSDKLRRPESTRRIPSFTSTVYVRFVRAGSAFCQGLVRRARPKLMAEHGDQHDQREIASRIEEVVGEQNHRERRRPRSRHRSVEKKDPGQENKIRGRRQRQPY